VPASLAPLLAGPKPGEQTQPWLERIAAALLREAVLEVEGAPHELVEIEFYLHGEGHRDPFTHNQAIQRSSGRWYFHRAGESYRGGTYKGVDLTFGPPAVFGGILIRSLLTPEGELICGSSLCVDHLLARTGQADVASLAAAIERRAGVLQLRSVAPRERTIYRTARVGLTLKRVAEHPEMLDYIVRPYRALTMPRAIKKGRVHLVVALHQLGETPDAIAALTGTPKRTITDYLAAYARGQALESTESLHGRSLSTTDLCLLHGALDQSPGSSKMAS
jgi:hypothetical protein